MFSERHKYGFSRIALDAVKRGPEFIYGSYATYSLTLQGVNILPLILRKGDRTLRECLHRRSYRVLRKRQPRNDLHGGHHPRRSTRQTQESIA